MKPEDLSHAQSLSAQIRRENSVYGYHAEEEGYETSSGEKRQKEVEELCDFVVRLVARCVELEDLMRKEEAS